MTKVEIKAELFGVVSGWCKLRLLVMLIDAYPDALARDDVTAYLWMPRARPTRPKDSLRAPPARPEASLRATVAQTNAVLSAGGARWRVLRLDGGRSLKLVGATRDA